MSCKNCGGTMIGDGYTMAYHCEFVDLDLYNMPEPDVNPIFCSDEIKIGIFGVYIVRKELTNES